MRRVFVRTGAPATNVTITLGEAAYDRTCGTCYARPGDSCKNIASGLPMLGVHAMRMAPTRSAS